MKPGEDVIAFVDAVIDSSRYYVLRIKDPKSSRTTLLGVGFRERDTAFDFKQILNDYVRYVDRMAQADTLSRKREIDEAAAAAEEEDGSGGASSVYSLDLAIKEGMKISIPIKVGAQKKAPTGAGGTRPKGIGLAPPPPPGSTVFAHMPVVAADVAAVDASWASLDWEQQANEKINQQQKPANEGDEEFGDFEEA